MRFRANGGAPWLLALAFVAACDPKAGLESAAGSIDPDEKSYIDGSGSLLAPGAFASIGIDYDPETSVHLLARRRDDGGQSMTLFGQDAQTGCTIAPNVATWFPGTPAQKPYRLLPYFEARDQNGVGTLHFSSIDCKVEPYTVEGAVGLTDPMIDTGFLIRQNGGLVVADPWLGTTTQVVTSLNDVYDLGSEFLVWGDGQVIAFDEAMNELGRFGKNVKTVANVDFEANFALEDDDGVSQLVIGGTSASFQLQALDPAACALSMNSALVGEIVVHSPCSDPHLVALDLDPVNTTDPTRVMFDVTADPSNAVIIADTQSTNSTTLAIAAYYLENVDATTGLGQLFAARPGTPGVALGNQAPLDRASVLVSASDGWAGTALVDVQNGVGRLLRWKWDGTTETLLQGVARSTSVTGVLANYDGVAGDLYSLDASGEPTLVENGAPPFNTTLRNGDFSQALRLEQWDGTVGELTLANGAEASFSAAAEHVPANQYQFTNIIPLPGFAYLGDYDRTAAAGTLVVQNTALGATSTVASGVSDFVATNYPLPGVLYAVPAGQNAGIWFARAK